MWKIKNKVKDLLPEWSVAFECHAHFKSFEEEGKKWIELAWGKLPKTVKRVKLSDYIEWDFEEDEFWYYFEWYASTRDKDSQWDVVIPKWIDLERFCDNSVMLLQHDMEKPIGKFLSVEIRQRWLYVKGLVTIDTDNVFKAVRTWVIKTMSIWFMVNTLDDVSYDEETRTFFLNKIHLYEISLVSVPANAKATLKWISRIQDAWDLDDEEFRESFEVEKQGNYWLYESLKKTYLENNKNTMTKDLTTENVEEVKADEVAEEIVEEKTIETTEAEVTTEEVVEETTNEVTEEVTTEEKAIEPTEVEVPVADAKDEEAVEELVESTKSIDAEEATDEVVETEEETPEAVEEEKSEEVETKDLDEEANEELDEEVTEEAEEVVEETETPENGDASENDVELNKSIVESTVDTWAIADETFSKAKTLISSEFNDIKKELNEYRTGVDSAVKAIEIMLEAVNKKIDVLNELEESISKFEAKKGYTYEKPQVKTSEFRSKMKGLVDEAMRIQ